MPVYGGYDIFETKVADVALFNPEGSLWKDLREHTLLKTPPAEIDNTLDHCCQ